MMLLLSNFLDVILESTFGPSGLSVEPVLIIAIVYEYIGMFVYNTFY